MTDNTLRIVSAVADKKQVVLYKEDGDTLVIKQGDHRLKDLLDAIIPITTRGEVAVVALDEFSVYSAFERKTQNEGGFTKFFRVAKKALTKVFGGEEDDKEKTPISPETVGALQNALNPQPVAQPEPPILQGGGRVHPAHPTTPAPTPTPTPAEVLKDDLRPMGESDAPGEDETIVAVTGSGEVIPDIEKVKPLIDHAVRANSPKAVENFLSRVGKMISKRQHSVEDIMRFLEKGDLPLAEDGSVIAYKMLRNHETKKDTFVDCHTRRIPQKVGSYVCVDESLVDTNRRNECSNGLHIARRGYLGGFGGDVCVLTKIDPEDIITVPHGDPNKVRVKGYHILGVLSQEAMAILKQNKPMTGEPAALAMVWQAIKGKHVARLEEVRVRAGMGMDVLITPLKPVAVVEEESSPEAQEMRQAAALDDATNTAGSVEPRDINKRINAEIESRAGQLSGSTPEVALTDGLDGVEEEGDEDLSDETEEELEQGLADAMSEDLAQPDTSDIPEATPEMMAEAKVVQPKAQTPAEAKRVERAAKKKAKAGAKKEKATPASKAPAKAAKPNPNAHLAKTAAAGKRMADEKAAKKASVSKAVAIAPKAAGVKLTKADEARALFNAGKLAELRDFKKRAKKGWSVLGFTDAEVEKIVPES